MVTPGRSSGDLPVTQPISPVDEVLTMYARLGGVQVIGEPVRQIEHALQTAWLAEQAGVPPALVAAALLHDMGHLIGVGDGPVGPIPDDPNHAEIAATFLSSRFPAEVVEPVRLHVTAKRYLCTVEPGYPSQLTQASRVALESQGGLMSPAEAAAFLDNPFAAEALMLRRWDEVAQVPGMATPSCAHFRAALEAVACRPGTAA